MLESWCDFEIFVLELFSEDQQVLDLKFVHKKLVKCQFKVVIDKHVNDFFLLHRNYFSVFHA